MGPHTGKEAALELLLDQPGRLEPGLVVLDRRLPLDESVEVDALLRDSLGYPVVVLFTRGEIAAELGRMAAVAAGLQRGRFLLARLYQDKGLDATLRPRFVLLGARFADQDAALLDMMSGVEVHALEYRVVAGGGGQNVLDLASFHRTSGPSLVKGGWRGAELASPPTPTGLSPNPASGLVPGAVPGLPSGSAAPTPLAPGSSTSGTHASAHGGAHGGTGVGTSGAASGGMGGGLSGGTLGATPGGVHAGAHGVAAGASASIHAGTAASPVAPASAIAASADYPGASAPSGGRFGQLERVGAEELHLLDEDLANPELARSYFLRARDSIRSLSSHVSENADQGRVRYHVRGAPLATLALDSTGFHIQVGDAAGEGLRVADEASFNERLNAVFTLYFHHLGPDRPTA